MNTISIKELRQYLRELQITWLMMAPDHQEYGCHANIYIISANESVIHLELQNKHLHIGIYRDYVMVDVKRNHDTVLQTFLFGDVPTDPADLYAILMKQALRNGKGRGILEKHQALIEWSWKGLLKAIRPIEVEDLDTVYNYDS
jgi:hypothetical protein